MRRPSSAPRSARARPRRLPHASSTSSSRSWRAASARGRSRCRSAMPRSCGLPQGDLFAQVLPPVMLGSLTAIVLAGTLNFVGKRYPRLTGEGRLQPDEHDESTAAGRGRIGHDSMSPRSAPPRLTAITLYLIGVMAQRFGLPAPVTMLFLAVIVKLARAVSPQLQRALRRLPVLLDRGDLPAAVRDRRCADALGQADGAFTCRTSSRSCRRW